jgi:hypothetical protein
MRFNLRRVQIRVPIKRHLNVLPMYTIQAVLSSSYEYDRTVGTRAEIRPGHLGSGHCDVLAPGVGFCHAISPHNNERYE